jgi:hypothetical protein
MKHLSYVLTLVLIFFVACRRQQSVSTPLNAAERILKDNPDSAFRIIQSIPYPDKLDKEDLVRWCLIAGKAADKLNTSLPPSYYFDHAYSWLIKYGITKDQVDIGLFGGRSLVADGEYDKAMSIYAEVLAIAKEKELYNEAGYICTYIADLYDFRDMQKEARHQYEEAQGLFKKAGNIKSHVFALQNIAREWAFFDSLECALKYMGIADSIAQQLNDNEVSSSLDNAFGNIYLAMNQYSKAEYHFLKSTSLDKENELYNTNCLIKLYLQVGDILKARELLYTLPLDSSEYEYGIERAFYRVTKAEGSYKEALKHLEACESISDSITILQNNTKILEVEKKFNNLRLKEKNHQLELTQQKYMIIICICLIFGIAITLLYLLYRQKTKNEMNKQALELNNIKLELANAFIELDKKKNQLVVSQKENESSQSRLENEIKNLTSNYKKLQRRRIVTSIIFRKLVNIAERSTNCNEPLLTEQLWFSIVSEITETYPNLKMYLLERYPNLSSQEWEYCCLCMFNFDSKTEARLLGINPSSVSTKRLRFRQKLGISALQEEANLCEYLINELLK